MSWWAGWQKGFFGSGPSARQQAKNAHAALIADRDRLAADFERVSADINRAMAKLTVPLPVPVLQAQTSQVRTGLPPTSLVSPPGSMRLIHYGATPSASSYPAGTKVINYRPYDGATDPKRYWAWLDRCDGSGWQAIDEDYIVQPGEVLSFQPSPTPSDITPEETEQLHQSFISLRRSLDNMGPS